MIIHQQSAQPRTLQFCIKPELGMVWDPAFPRLASANKNFCCVSILNKDLWFLISLAKLEVSHSLRYSCFLRAQKGFCPKEPLARHGMCKPAQAPSEKAQSDLGNGSEPFWTWQSSLITRVQLLLGAAVNNHPHQLVGFAWHRSAFILLPALEAPCVALKQRK